MDRTIPAFNADSARRLSHRFQFGSSANSTQTMQSGLFEQLLSMPTPAHAERQTPPSPSAIETNPASSSDNSSSERVSDSQGTSDENSDAFDDQDDLHASVEEQVEKGANENQVALLTAAATIATESPSKAEDSAQAANKLDGLNANSELSDNVLGEADNPTPLSLSPTSQAAVDADNATATSQLATKTNTDLQQTENTSLAKSTGGDADGKVQAETNAKGTAELDVLAADELDLSVAINEETPETRLTTLAGTTSQESDSNAQPDPTIQGEGKTRGQRREKWYERSNDSSAGPLPADDRDSFADEHSADQVSQQYLSVAAEDTTIGVAANGQLSDSGSELQNNSPLSEAAWSPVGLAPTTADVTASAFLSSSSSIDSMEAIGALSSEGGTTTSSGREGIDAKGSNASPQRTEGKAATTETQRSDALTQAERVRLVQRVSRSFARLGPMGGQISLKLHPPQLGSLNVQVRLEGRSMMAKLTTETSTARDTILENLPVLRSRLAERGFEISSFQVEVADNNADPTSSSGNSQGSFEQAGDGGDGNSNGRTVDYRRLAAQQRSSIANYELTAGSGSAPRELAWQVLTGVDLQA